MIVQKESAPMLVHSSHDAVLLGRGSEANAAWPEGRHTIHPRAKPSTNAAAPAIDRRVVTEIGDVDGPATTAPVAIHWSPRLSIQTAAAITSHITARPARRLSTAHCSTATVAALASENTSD